MFSDVANMQINRTIFVCSGAIKKDFNYFVHEKKEKYRL